MVVIRVFLYCKSVDEAETLKNKIDKLINSSLNIDCKSTVKRGCSEFSIKIS